MERQDFDIGWGEDLGGGEERGIGEKYEKRVLIRDYRGGMKVL